MPKNQETLIVKKNIKTYPIPIPGNLRRYVPKRNLSRHKLHMLVEKGEEITVFKLLAQHLRDKHGNLFKK